MAHFRTLIVEDQQGKIAKIVDLLAQKAGCSRDSIDVAQSGFDARRLLQANQYDLMILDVVLPNRPEEQPQKDGGVELLREVMERDSYFRPKYIIGLTGFPEAFQTAAGEFADYTWAIVQYQEETQSWHDPLLQLTNHIVRTQSQASEGIRNYGTDICVVTALPMELEALMRIDWNWEAQRIDGDPITYKRTTVACGNAGAEVIVGCCPRMGMVSAAILASNMIRTFKPRLVVMTGICAGLRERVSIGDVVVADPTWDYQSGKLFNGDFLPAPHQLPLLTAIRRRLSELAEREFLDEIKRRWTSRAPKTSISLHVAPTASGSAVLADKDRLAELKRQHRQLSAIDMEVYGVYAAAAEAPSPTPHAVAIKGVSDLGDESKGDEFQEYAAYVSAAVFSQFVMKEYLALRDFLGR